MLRGVGFGVGRGVGVVAVILRSSRIRLRCVCLGFVTGFIFELCQLFRQEGTARRSSRNSRPAAISGSVTSRE